MINKDYSERVFELKDKFVIRYGDQQDSLFMRVLNKFGLLYAAGVIGIESKLLPWTHSWLQRSIDHCCEKAKQELNSLDDNLESDIGELLNAIRNKRLFVGVQGTPIRQDRWRDGQLGFVARTKGRQTAWISRSDLGQCNLLSCKTAHLFETLKQLGAIQESGNQTQSEQIRLTATDGKTIKVRFTKVDVVILKDWQLKRFGPVCDESDSGKSIKRLGNLIKPPIVMSSGKARSNETYKATTIRKKVPRVNVEQKLRK